MADESLRGHYLIAGKTLRDPNFFRTIVLVVEHSSEGAMGVVVNRPSCVTVAHALSEHFNLPETDDLVFLGGPVDPSALIILHNQPEPEGNDQAVIPGVYLGSNAEIFESVVRGAAEGDPDLNFRIFSGYAGWAPGQLESELERGDWLVLPAAAESLFLEDSYAIWDLLVKQFAETRHALPRGEGNPEWN